MFKVTVPQQCGCFRRSGKEDLTVFDNKDDALMHATNMSEYMNREFCKKHKFNVVENGDTFLISMSPAKQTVS